ncbi:glycosyltransferase family 9 protein [Actinomadura atramentaria]|uniref:glycosyltransferase family 9 protein n=1 Tax=Actinomadura atramentaria TaxID=1990 RepID=UPI00037CBD3A|nr:glycosyltransferase family 9 protein [Actinomadura atramentaria]
MARGLNALVVRLDNAGDVLLAGPAVRAVAARAGPVTLLVGPQGAAAARLLPGVADVIVYDAPWVGFAPPAFDGTAAADLVARLAGREFTDAVVLTSFHQSPLPIALLLRMAGVTRITGISDDYPGALLDVRLRGDPDLPEPERALAVAAAAGFPRPPGDDGRLAVRRPLPDVRGLAGDGPYVIVHPGASVRSRRWPAERCAETVGVLADRGLRPVVTGGPDERALTTLVAGRIGTDLGGRTDWPELAAVFAGASAVVTGNTGPAHLAAAVGAPVVSLFAPVVPAERWAPYGVPRVLLGDQAAACRGSRARDCPVPGHPCLMGVTAADAADAVEKLIAEGTS